MKSFKVTVRQTFTREGVAIVNAETEENAVSFARATVNNYGSRLLYNWTLSDKIETVTAEEFSANAETGSSSEKTSTTEGK